MSRPLFEHLRATTTRRLTTITCCLVVVFIVHSLVQSFRHDRIPRPSRYFVSPNYTHIARLAFQSPESGPYRLPDTVDTFADYKHRSSCNISSLDLHGAFGPLCVDRKAMLAAMSGGGRIGKDAPYMPRGCDMRWFTSEEVCEILGRFEKVIIVGDSMMRHVIGSMNVLIRKDLGYGAVTDWNFSPQER